LTHLSLEIPDEETIVTAANDILNSLKDWKRGATYDGGIVKTYFRGVIGDDGNNWHSRVSEHDQSDGTFDDFWTYLGEITSKAEHEKK
jgi:hypothetical protein